MIHPETTAPDPEVQRILHYLEHRWPDYRFDPQIDPDFVTELIDDSPDLDLLEQIKTMRWYYETPPKKPRAAIRRWLANARKRRSW